MLEFLKPGALSGISRLSFTAKETGGDIWVLSWPLSKGYYYNWERNGIISSMEVPTDHLLAPL